MCVCVCVLQAALARERELETSAGDQVQHMAQLQRSVEQEKDRVRGETRNTPPATQPATHRQVLVQH